MSGHILLLDEHNNAIALDERKYDDEDLFQRLIAEHPELLAGEQITPDEPRKWILIKREMGVPAYEGSGDWYSIDHLFVDQDSIPTLVEVKRSSDTRLRREVVAQMLDYAANLRFWPARHLRELYEEQHTTPPFDYDPEHTEQFWEQVDANLSSGTLRLIFAADDIPEGLQRVIEFLNEKMQGVEVIGLEIKQYLSDRDHRILVPKIVGRTIAAAEKKRRPGSAWTLETFLARVAGTVGNDAAEMCRRLLDRFADMGLVITWGQGAVEAGFSVRFRGFLLISVYSYTKQAKITFPLGEYKPPLQDESVRLEVIRLLNTIPDVQIDASSLSRSPSFDCLVLHDAQSMDAFLHVISYLQGVIRRSESEGAL